MAVQGKRRLASDVGRGRNGGAERGGVYPDLMSPPPGLVQMPRSSRCLAVRLMACRRSAAGTVAQGRGTCSDTNDTIATNTQLPAFAARGWQAPYSCRRTPPSVRHTCTHTHRRTHTGAHTQGRTHTHTGAQAPPRQHHHPSPASPHRSPPPETRWRRRQSRRHCRCRRRRSSGKASSSA